MLNAVLPLLKSRKGISTDTRDPLLSAIIAGILDDLEKVYGIKLDETRSDHILLVLDWATWKYDHPEDGTTPRSIQFRIHNLFFRIGGGGNG